MATLPPRLPRVWTWPLIAGLAILVFAAVHRSQVQPIDKRAQTVDQLRLLHQAIGRFRSQWDALPPSDPLELEDLIARTQFLPEEMNATNRGSEALLCGLLLPSQIAEGRTETLATLDTDGDETLGEGGRSILREPSDPFGNPFIYLTWDKYVEADEGSAPYRTGDGLIVHARPLKRPNGRFVAPKAYQLYSMGPDGRPNTLDDIAIVFPTR